MIYSMLLLASGLPATVYGYGEQYCGDAHQYRRCEKGAVTASGVGFDPSLPQVAVAAPSDLLVRPTWIGLRVLGGPCVKVHLVDKMSPKWVGRRGFDLTPAAVDALTGGKSHKSWSEKVFVCDFRELRVESYLAGTFAPVPKDNYAPSFVSPFINLYRLFEPYRLRPILESSTRSRGPNPRTYRVPQTPNR